MEMNNQIKPFQDKKECEERKARWMWLIKLNMAWLEGGLGVEVQKKRDVGVEMEVKADYLRGSGRRNQSPEA